MKRGRSTGTPTQAQSERMNAIKEAGCVIANDRGLGFVPCEIHHLTIGGRHGQKRRGHDFIVGLNSWSHRGVTIYGFNEQECRDKFGPSYAKEPRAFREIYPDDFLIQLQKEQLGEDL